jgi:hypothetical protein
LDGIDNSHGSSVTEKTRIRRKKGRKNRKRKGGRKRERK